MTTADKAKGLAAECPQPPSHKIKQAGHWWLEVLDTDGHSFGLVALQWNPGARKWSRSNQVGTGMYVETTNYKLIEEIPLPEFATLTRHPEPAAGEAQALRAEWGALIKSSRATLRALSGAQAAAVANDQHGTALYREAGRAIIAIDQLCAALAVSPPAASAPAREEGLPEGMVLAPHFRGYAKLGVGAYVINHSIVGSPPELIISIATDEEKANRQIGEERPNPEGHMLQPEVMAVRIEFTSAAGLDALEARLKHLRDEHFPGSVSPLAAPSPASVPAAGAGAGEKHE